MPGSTAVVVFLAFAAAYFLSALIRAITATLSPALTQEFALHARDLGLLGGGYFGLQRNCRWVPGWTIWTKESFFACCWSLYWGAAFATATSLAGCCCKILSSGPQCLPDEATTVFGAGLQVLRCGPPWMLMTGAFGMVASFH